MCSKSGKILLFDLWYRGSWYDHDRKNLDKKNYAYFFVQLFYFNFINTSFNIVKLSELFELPTQLIMKRGYFLKIGVGVWKFQKARSWYTSPLFLFFHIILLFSLYNNFIYRHFPPLPFLPIKKSIQTLILRFWILYFIFNIILLA